MKASFALVLAALLAAPLQSAGLAAQARDPSSVLVRVLPADVAQRVLARVADARARGLPAEALEDRALELSAKGVAPDRIERAVESQVAALESGRRALAAGGHPQAGDDEVEAAATALGKGVDGNQVSELAKSAPSGRSLAVPLLVISSLVDRGLPSDDALSSVLARLEDRASDRQLAGLVQAPGRSGDQGPTLTGQAPGATVRPTDAGRPAWVPANAGAGNRPASPGPPAGKGKP